MNTQEIFNSQFKFDINDSLRHKGDTHKHDSDMGLLVLERHLLESLDGDGNRSYERCYVCRMIRWSGSGDLARFNERELMTVAEHEKEKIERHRESDEMRNSMRMVEKEVMELFGISKEDYLYEMVDGKAVKEKKFRMSGFKSDENGIVLYVRESLFTAANRKTESEKFSPETREWKSKEQFEKAQ